MGPIRHDSDVNRGKMHEKKKTCSSRVECAKGEGASEIMRTRDTNPPLFFLSFILSLRYLVSFLRDGGGADRLKAP